MSVTNKNLLCIALSTFSLSFLGCGGDGLPKRVPVTGTVTHNGKAVEAATVSFHGEGAPRVASGVTDSSGKFTLTTYTANDGAIPGNHTVTVVKLDKGAVQGADAAQDGNANADPEAGGAAYAKAMALAAKDAKQGAKDMLPPIYADPTRSPLKQTVSESGANNFTIELK